MRLLWAVVLLVGCEAAELKIEGTDSGFVGSGTGSATATATGTGTGTGGTSDQDGDGFGTDDCDDSDALAYPGAPEICDGVDNDCDGTVDPGDTCPCPGETFEGRLYIFCPNEASWSEAQAKCAEAGMHLVSIASDPENDFVAAGVGISGGGSWWLGATDRTSEGTWTWDDGGPFGFEAWGPGEPNDFGTGEDCAQIFGDGVWNDASCDRPMPYICEGR